jgi:hypothetical protein
MRNRENGENCIRTLLVYFACKLEVSALILYNQKEIRFFTLLHFVYEFRGEYKLPLFQNLKNSIDFQEIWHEYQIIRGHPTA